MLALYGMVDDQVEQASEPMEAVVEPESAVESNDVSAGPYMVQ